MAKHLNEIYEEYIIEKSNINDIVSYKLNNEEDTKKHIDYYSISSKVADFIKNSKPSVKDWELQVTDIKELKKIYMPWWNWNKHIMVETTPFYGNQNLLRIKTKSIATYEDYKDKDYDDVVIPYNVLEDAELYPEKQANHYMKIITDILKKVEENYNKSTTIEEGWDDIDSAKLNAEEDEINISIYISDFIDVVRRKTSNGEMPMVHGWSWHRGISGIWLYHETYDDIHILIKLYEKNNKMFIKSTIKATNIEKTEELLDEEFDTSKNIDIDLAYLLEVAEQLVTEAESKRNQGWAPLAPSPLKILDDLLENFHVGYNVESYKNEPWHVVSQNKKITEDGKIIYNITWMSSAQPQDIYIEQSFVYTNNDNIRFYCYAFALDDELLVWEHERYNATYNSNVFSSFKTSDNFNDVYISSTKYIMNLIEVDYDKWYATKKNITEGWKDIDSAKLNAEEDRGTILDDIENVENFTQGLIDYIDLNFANIENVIFDKEKSRILTKQYSNINLFFKLTDLNNTYYDILLYSNKEYKNISFEPIYHIYPYDGASTNIDPLQLLGWSRSIPSKVITQDNEHFYEFIKNIAIHYFVDRVNGEK